MRNIGCGKNLNIRRGRDNCNSINPFLWDNYWNSFELLIIKIVNILRFLVVICLNLFICQTRSNRNTKTWLKLEQIQKHDLGNIRSNKISQLMPCPIIVKQFNFKTAACSLCLFFSCDLSIYRILSKIESTQKFSSGSMLHHTDVL